MIKAREIKVKEIKEAAKGGDIGSTKTSKRID